jgi:chemotaxis protein methyltransferase CheR
MSDLVLSKRDFDRLRGLIEGWCGIAVDRSKSYLIETRLRHLVAESGCSGYGQLYELAARGDEHLQGRIIDSITINETSWFRDRGFYDALRGLVIPEMVSRARAEGSRSLRIWSAACSTGQEPYSLAILLQEMERAGEIPLLTPRRVEIVATDICHSVLALAQLGRYDPISMRRGLDPDLRERYFEKQGRVAVIRPEVRERVTFRRFNLLDPMDALGTFDLVLMRNVMLYFSTAVKQEVLHRVLNVLRPDAPFAAGASEALEVYTRDFEVVRQPSCTYYYARPKSEPEGKEEGRVR